MDSDLQLVWGMLDKQQIITELYKTQFIENYLKTFVRANDIEHIADEIQEIYLIVCQTDEERLKQMYEKDGINGVRRFFAGVIHRQMNSKTSKIHSLYRKRQNILYSANALTVEELELGKNKYEKMIEN